MLKKSFTARGHTTQPSTLDISSASHKQAEVAYASKLDKSSLSHSCHTCILVTCCKCLCLMMSSPATTSVNLSLRGFGLEFCFNMHIIFHILHIFFVILFTYNRSFLTLNFSGWLDGRVEHQHMGCLH